MWKILLALLMLALLLGGGGYAAYRGYKHVRQVRLVKQARAYLEKSNTRKALLCVQRALGYNSRDVEACRLMAQLTEAARSPSALLWRSRVVELNPRSVEDRLALTQTALSLRDYASATNALEGVDAAGKKTAGYHNIAGAVAAAANQPAQAEAHFLEAVRLEPLNAAPQLNLAVVRLQSTNAQSLDAARTALQQISSNPTNAALRCQALRELVTDAIRSKQTAAALALSKELLQQTNSIFRDRLLRLDVLRETRSAEFKPLLADYQREAASDPTNTARISELAMWQMAKTSPAETLAWLRTLPQDTQTNQPVSLLVADCLMMRQDWRGLQASIDPQNWAELEFLRRAYKARALRGQDLSGAAKGEWELALKAANGQKAGLVMLLRMAAQWKWQSETEELLWSIVNQFPGEPWAVQALTQALFVNGRTRPLLMFYSQQLKRTPADLGAKNNLAMTAFLLEAMEFKPHDLAREVYEKAPTNAAYASTYAFSLLIQKKNTEALQVMQRLTPQDLQNPSIAGYYGLALKATGNGEKARSYLDWAFKAPMLPEEKKLFEKAKAGG